MLILFETRIIRTDLISKWNEDLSVTEISSSTDSPLYLLTCSSRTSTAYEWSRLNTGKIIEFPGYLGLPRFCKILKYELQIEKTEYTEMGIFVPNFAYNTGTLKITIATISERTGLISSQIYENLW